MNLYTNKNVKKMNRTYNRMLKKSLFSKNILSVKKTKTSLLEIVIKFFIKIIMLIAVPIRLKKNKNKLSELVGRVYKRFTSREFAFIPVSFAFYSLVSFIPIIMSVSVAISLIPGNFSSLFNDEILRRIIPGLESFINSIPQTWNAKTYILIITLFLASLIISSSGFGKFTYSINYIYKHETTGNYFFNRLKGFLIVVCIALYIFISSLLYLSIYKLFGVHKASALGRSIYFYIVFSLYLMLNLYVGLSLLFKVSPAFKVPWSSLLPGVLIASLPTMVFITIFGYLTSLIDYYKFGIFGIFMYIALLVSTMSYFMYLGIITNAAFYKTFYSRYTVAKKIWFRKFY
ncbi:YihY/virulence factor BrkB family protein [Mycoplasmopsis agalactiae]|uniref:YihY/virulence factor BrkB family protein n=1 Tax=Mycoplasmopsis agalactiae TaxID=2110 RepID=UPI001F45218A|nr:YhjD/YihY/BrkB family envelope integrity protein [Mycoplasmopsis agalactiae]MCE6114928.1 YihY/virulence factor BrkB family protein [Mycoplasmopsis agalactiae]